MKTLLNKKDMKLSVKLGETWNDPVLIMKEGKNETVITASSGELEYLPGEFLINENMLTGKQLEKVEEVLLEIADPESIEQIEGRKAKRFVLNKEYMAKLEELSK